MDKHKYIEINKDWEWFIDEFHKFCEEEKVNTYEEYTPRCIVAFEPIFESYF